MTSLMRISSRGTAIVDVGFGSMQISMFDKTFW